MPARSPPSALWVGIRTRLRPATPDVKVNRYALRGHAAHAGQHERLEHQVRDLSARSRPRGLCPEEEAAVGDHAVPRLQTADDLDRIAHGAPDLDATFDEPSLALGGHVH